jgi:hypothetical protein
MSAANNHRLNIETLGKDTYFLSQLKAVYNYLKENTATATMVADATGISQKNICRYKRFLEKNGQIAEIEKKPCKSTGFKAWYLTTNPEAFPKSKQLALI